jgi:hypothetical protein
MVWASEIQVTGVVTGVVPLVRVNPFVMSITIGGFANVPYARNWPVPSRLSVVIEPGRIVIESRSSPAGALPEPAGAVTVRVALADTGPLNPCAVAVIVAVPAPFAVAFPEAGSTVTIVEELDAHVTPLVTGCDVAWFALPYVPVTPNCVL